MLTGETGAGKSILLDAFSLALGGRGDGGLVRSGQPQGQVVAVFDTPHDHPARLAAAEQGLAVDGDLILRRVQMADGRSRAFVNDQPVSIQALKAIGRELVEIHGQHDDRALIDPAAHRALADAYGGLEPLVAKDAGRLCRAQAGGKGLAAKNASRWRPPARKPIILRHAHEEYPSSNRSRARRKNSRPSARR